MVPVTFTWKADISHLVHSGITDEDTHGNAPPVQEQEYLQH